MKKIIAMAGACFIAFSLYAADPPADTIARWEYKGRAYENVKIQTLHEADAILRHDGGLLKVKLADLPEQWRNKLFDADKVARFEKDEAARKELEALADQIPQEQFKEKNYRIVDGKMVPIAQMSHLQGKVFKVLLPDAVLIHSYSTTTGGEKDFGPDVRVVCGPDKAKDLRENADVMFVAMKTGPFEYKNFIGMKKIYDSYDTGTAYISETLKKLAGAGLYTPPTTTAHH